MVPSFRVATALQYHLVAGFHSRFGPPPPFPTTLTGYPSSSPVTFFGHTRPWGLLSLLPAWWPLRSGRSLSSRTRGTRPDARGSRPTSALVRRSSPSLRSHRSSRRGGCSGSGIPLRSPPHRGQATHPLSRAAVMWPRWPGFPPTSCRSSRSYCRPDGSASPQGLPLPHSSDLLPFLRGPWPVSPGTGPCGPACAPSRLPLGHRLLTSASFSPAAAGSLRGVHRPATAAAGAEDLLQLVKERQPGRLTPFP
jgi:hypothetical protein